MQILYTKPKLRDLSQGSRIAFARQFRMMSQNDVSDKLGITGECKRRTMTRYEKGERNPKIDRLEDISKILNVNVNSLRNYDYKEPVAIIYILLWMEELIPNYSIAISKVPRVNDYYINLLKKSLTEWNNIKAQKLRKEISYEEYIEWKLNYEIKDEL